MTKPQHNSTRRAGRAFVVRQNKWLPTGVATLALALLLAPNAQAKEWVGKDFRGKNCEGEQGTAGAHDYLHRGFKKNVAGLLKLTERHHYNEDVENLVKGLTTEPMGDTDFVLRSFPNHHRALQTAMKYRLKRKKWSPKEKWPPAECYYQRAINFSPRDLTVHLQYAILQYKMKKYTGALKTYQAADKLNPNDPLLLYNMALTMIKVKKYKQAKAVAKRVYATGFPLPGLRNKLITAGHWKDETSAETLEDKAKKLKLKKANEAKKAESAAKDKKPEPEKADSA
ncbi:MAG: tetratricopeptide repeat protein [Pseudomonadales bacterium]